jgi:methylthioribose-1-phosphate isomerase
MYVAAPTSTFDPSLPSGDHIIIEQRARDEVARGFGRTTVPEQVAVANPAFDVTPAELITAIISDQGVHYPPYDFSGGGLHAVRPATVPRDEPSRRGPLRQQAPSTP